LPGGPTKGWRCGCCCGRRGSIPAFLAALCKPWLSICAMDAFAGIFDQPFVVFEAATGAGAGACGFGASGVLFVGCGVLAGGAIAL